MNETILETTTQAVQGQLINRIVIALAIIFVGLIIGRLIGRLVERMLRDFAVDATVRKKIKTGMSFQKVIGRVVSIAIYLVFILIAINYVGVVGLLFNIISIAVLAVVVISLILTINDAMPNIIAYQQLRRTNAFSVGDHIQFGAAKGTVKSCSLFETRIETAKGETIHIPNALFMKEQWSRKAHKTSSKQAN